MLQFLLKVQCAYYYSYPILPVFDVKYFFVLNTVPS